jgi:hypothetical protein
VRNSKDLKRLHAIAGLILDQKLATLRTKAAARDASLSRLHALAPKGMQNFESIAQMQMELRHESWAGARRAEINIKLARQTADWMEARHAAETAFGKAEVLRKLGKKG